MALYVLAGTFLWNSVLVYFGLKVGENWQLVIAVLHTYNQVVLILGVTVLLVYFGVKWWKRAQRKPQVMEGSDREAV